MQQVSEQAFSTRSGVGIFLKLRNVSNRAVGGGRLMITKHMAERQSAWKSASIAGSLTVGKRRGSARGGGGFVRGMRVREAGVG